MSEEKEFNRKEPEWTPSAALRGLRSVMEELNKTGEKQWRVLVVDDGFDDRVLMRRLLRKYPCDVEEAKDADEAINKLLQPPDNYDLVFIDMRLDGGKDAVDVVKRVKQDKPDVRFVIMSGFENPAKLKDLAEFGLFTSLSKSNINMDLEFLFNNKPG